MTRTSLLIVVLSIALASACEDPPPPTFRVTFTATSDDVKLPGVELTIAGRSVGQTNANGELQINLHGREGAAIPYRVRCPAGHRELTNAFSLTLRSFRGIAPQAHARGVEVAVHCLPSDRYAAVVVRTGGRVDIPVKIQGEEVTRTDSGGVAHLLLRLAPETSFRVALDTSANPRLTPANPAETFTLNDADDIFIFDQQFTETRPPRPPHRPRPPVDHGPVNLTHQRRR